jgi:uncharacterized protein YdeI (YjbR/CyaY-like superfamily)
MATRLSSGVVHDVPTDLRKVLISDAAARAKWEDLTPLARNEWICWTISVKKPETRKQHVERVCSQLAPSVLLARLSSQIEQTGMQTTRR